MQDATYLTEHTVGFSVSGEFITEHARNLWIEGAYTKAIDVLECLMGSTHEQQMQILFGTKKVVGINDLDFVDDEWSPGEGVDYPTFKEAMGRGDDWQELQNMRMANAWQIAYDEWPITRGRKEERLSLWNRVEKLVGKDKAKKIFDEVMHEYADQYKTYRDETLMTDSRAGRVDPLTALYAETQAQLTLSAAAAGLDIDAMPSVDAMMNHGEKIGCVLDEHMTSASGWLLPNGNYYGCGSMEHIGLATALLEHTGSKVDHGGNAELIAEAFGWVKISRSMLGLYVICKKTPAKKQFDKLWDYSVLHNKDYESMVQSLKDFKHEYAT